MKKKQLTIKKQLSLVIDSFSEREWDGQFSVYQGERDARVPSGNDRVQDWNPPTYQEYQTGYTRHQSALVC